MKSEVVYLTGNTCWYCPQVSISVYQKRGKYFSGIKIFHAYNRDKYSSRTFRLARILK